MSEGRLGVSGTIARKFLLSEVTPLLALAGFLLGLFAVAITPREEDPQIEVTFANVMIPFPGARPAEVENLVASPAEQVLSEIKDIEHVYSVSRPGMAIITVQYKVGLERTEAIVRLYNKIFSNQDWLPENLGVRQPIIKPKGIDDVPIITLTLWTEDQERAAYDLQKVAHAIEAELKRVPGTRDIYTLGGPDRVVHVRLDAQRMAGYGVALDDLRATLTSANTSLDAGALVRGNEEIIVQSGTFLSSAEEVGDLVVAVHEGKPVYLRDVAEIAHGPDQPERYVSFSTGRAAHRKGIEARGTFPAVTVAVAKKPGENAVTVAEEVIRRFEQLEGIFVPEGVNVTVTRNYGVTADDKAQTLIKKLIFATVSVVLLTLLALGWREALIVGVAVVLTLAITLFASWAWGFTLNRVSLFALIFSIGILVDDAIVVVENIHRHMLGSTEALHVVIPRAVDEVGGPTILATFTVIAALLPMAFVTGLMGPYMSPIPINASTGMVISLVVAFAVTPWLTHVLVRGTGHRHAGGEGGNDGGHYRFFSRLMRPFLRRAEGRSWRWGLLIAMAVLIAASVSLVGFRLVILKMLPFDDKPEFQVVVDMPEGTPVEQTARVLDELGRRLAEVPEVSDYQTYAGTHSPINFNGLVRQYYMRAGPYQGDIQVNLVDKHHRERKSHEIALGVRAPLQELGASHGANVKIVEVPPGPPVQSPLVAEVYGLDYGGQIRAAKQVREAFESTRGIVDADDSVEARSPKYVLRVDRQRATMLGVSQRQVAVAVATALRGEDVGYVHGANAKYPIPIRLEAPVGDKVAMEALLAMEVRAEDGTLVPLHDFAGVERTTRDRSIYHKDLLPVVFVTADMAGAIDSPLYGIFSIFSKLQTAELESGGTIEQHFIRQPDNPYEYGLKWDGEWQVTYETFRDMGIAYAVGLVLIYLLVVGQFGSYLVPLIIMVPIPLTVIGVMPGHALLGKEFTATSMIGMIALAGIIVRNSILLVDFIQLSYRGGADLEEAVIRSGAVRARPIVLTALAAMLGGFFILDDPIFNGLAISLIFGVFVSTVLTLLVIPVMYYAFTWKRVERAGPEG
ncbi:MAG: efflux RND transporter permease subunit [Gammaproteobacteria bacterium]|nr:efflux RND transporter permease subunit [Gammaproteobacteria bacterium]